MLKLYKNNEGTISYWETWDKDDKTGIVHWGLIGEKGQMKEVHSSLFKSFKKKVQSEINEKLGEGYREIAPEAHDTLLIEYLVNGMGSLQDMEKRHKLEEKMQQILGWTGLGDCDGGSIGSGTMEVCCNVVHFDTAKLIIEQALRGTEFSNYSRVYKQTDD